MKWTKFKWEALELVGFVFCECTFQWFDRIGDVPWDEEDWQWYHRIYYFIGVAPYKIGSFFYNLQDEQPQELDYEDDDQ